MLQTNNKTISLIQKIALYFFVICFSLSNISFFNMLLSYLGYQGDVTLISSAIYAFLNLFILTYFVYYVLSHKKYKLFLVIVLINLVYILPHLLNFTLRGIALYLMFPLPFSLFAGIIVVDQNIRKKIIDVFYKLRYVYSILGIAYIFFLIFSSEKNKGALIDFTYGNVAWVFLPPIFVYIGLIIQKDIFHKSQQNKYKAFELIVILLILEITVFYTGLRSGILSLLFAKFLFLIGFIIVDFKQKSKYVTNFLVLLSIVLITYLISTTITLEKSRINVISNRFLYERKVHDNDEETRLESLSVDKFEDKEIEKILSRNISDSAPIDKINIVDVEDKQIKSVHSLFIKHITENDLTQEKTEKKLTEDIKNDTRKYVITRGADREKLSSYSIHKDRYNLWNMAFLEFKKSPILGRGPLFFQTKHDGFFPHNIIIEVLTDFGILGLIIFLSFSILLTYKSINYLKQKKDKEMLLILLLGLSYIPAYLLYNSLYSDNSLAFLITLLATYVILNRDNKEIKVNEETDNAI